MLIAIATLTQLGIMSELMESTNNFSDINADLGAGFYDSSGHQVAYANRTYSGEGGVISVHYTDTMSGTEVAELCWHNSTSSHYPVYDANGQKQVQQTSTSNSSISLYGAAGLLAIITVFMLAGVALGIKFLGFGVSDMSIKVAVIAGVFIAIWGLFSILSASTITLVPFGQIFYLLLTVMYTLGIIGQVSGSGDGL